MSLGAVCHHCCDVHCLRGEWTRSSRERPDSSSCTRCNKSIGPHIFDKKKQASLIANVKQYFALWQLFYVTSTVPAKMSISFSLMRISVKKLHKQILWALMGASIIITIVAWVAVFTTCRPFAYTWDKTIKGGKCQPLNQIILLSYIVSVANVITDWTCAVLPVFILRGLQMARNVKISIYLILVMGTL